MVIADSSTPNFAKNLECTLESKQRILYAGLHGVAAVQGFHTGQSIPLGLDGRC